MAGARCLWQGACCGGGAPISEGCTRGHTTCGPAAARTSGPGTWADKGWVGLRPMPRSPPAKGPYASRPSAHACPGDPPASLLSRSSAPGPAGPPPGSPPPGHSFHSLSHVQFHPSASRHYSSGSPWPSRIKTGAPIPAPQGLPSCPVATVSLDSMCVLAWALGWPDVGQTCSGCFCKGVLDEINL